MGVPGTPGLHTEGHRTGILQKNIHILPKEDPLIHTCFQSLKVQYVTLIYSHFSRGKSGYYKHILPSSKTKHKLLHSPRRPIRPILPADGHRHGLRGGGTGTDDLWLQPVDLEHVEEGIAGRHRPLGRGKDRERDSTTMTSHNTDHFWRVPILTIQGFVYHLQLSYLLYVSPTDCLEGAIPLSIYRQQCFLVLSRLDQI